MLTGSTARFLVVTALLLVIGNVQAGGSARGALTQMLRGDDSELGTAPAGAPSGKKVCIFDIDNTLTHGELAESSQLCPGVTFVDTHPPRWPAHGGTTNEIIAVVKECKALGFEIAIATAESEEEAYNDTQFGFLAGVDADVFTPEFFKSDLFQRSCSVVKNSEYCKTTEYTDKSTMYMNIMNHFNIPPSEFGNSVVFDDDVTNLTTASRMGFRLCQASLQCGGGYCKQGCGTPLGCIGTLRNPWPMAPPSEL